jgi:hypothetical protein
MRQVERNSLIGASLLSWRLPPWPRRLTDVFGNVVKDILV